MKIIKVGFILFGLIFFLAGCDNVYNRKDDSSAHTHSPLMSLKGLEGEQWISTGKYDGEFKQELDTIKWKELDTKYSFNLINDGKVFVGSFGKNEIGEEILLYGASFVASESDEFGYYSFEEEDFIVSEYFITKAKMESKGFQKLDNESIPGASNNQKYLTSNSTQVVKGDRNFKSRIIKLNKTTLIRETQNESGKMICLKYIKVS